MLFRGGRNDWSSRVEVDLGEAVFRRHMYVISVCAWVQMPVCLHFWGVVKKGWITELSLRWALLQIKLRRSALTYFNSTVNILGWMIPCYGDCPAFCMIFNSIPGLYPLRCQQYLLPIIRPQNVSKHWSPYAYKKLTISGEKTVIQRLCNIFLYNLWHFTKEIRNRTKEINNRQQRQVHQCPGYWFIRYRY